MDNRKNIFDAEHYLSLDDGYPERPVSWFKEAMLPRINEVLVNKKHLLDVGCASGYYTKEFQREGLTITGIDFASNRIEHAIAKFSNQTLQFINAELENFKTNDMYDCMFTSMVIQHMPHHIKIQAFENLAKHATDDCLFLMYDFNSNKEDIGNDWVEPVSPQWLRKHVPWWQVKSCEPFCNEYETPNSTIWEYQLIKTK